MSMSAAKIVILSLGIGLVLVIIGIVLMGMIDHEVPEVLEALGGTITGALAGILARVHTDEIGSNGGVVIPQQGAQPIEPR